MNKSMVVIPAYNEERRIGHVVEVAREADPYVVADQFVVVDNNSSDATAEIALSLGAKVLQCLKQGKGWAMETGVQFARENGAQSVTFLDGDLIGLRPEHVNKLAAPVVFEEAVMNIGFLGERTELQKRILRRWGGFSGMRSVDLRIWDFVRERDLIGWRTEAALNRIVAHQGLGEQISRTELSGLRHEGTFNGDMSFIGGCYSYARKHTSALYGLTTQSGKPCPTEVDRV